MAVKLDRWEGAEERSRDEVFAELYESSYPSLVKYCRGLLGEGADPEEVAQEAFLRAWMTWDRYATTRPFWALVATIARNLCMDHHRHERVVSTVLEQRAGELTASPGISPEERVEQGEEFEWARQALAELCPNHQRLLHLREIDGWSTDDIAAADGTSPEAATAALYRARQRLRDAYNRVAAGAMAGLAYFPLRGVRRRFGLWAHSTGQLAASSPALVSRAGDAVATVVAIAVVSGTPVVNPLPQADAPERPPAAVAPGRATANAGPTAAAAGPANQSQAAKGAGAAALGAKVVAAAGTAVANPVVAGAPDGITGSQFTAAPTGSKSRDVYLSGLSPQSKDSSCVSGPCSVLFHSSDGGTTWERLLATGFSGGTVLLAPNFPVDRRVFAAGTSGLQVSTDNGATFSTIVPLAGPSAISPAFASDHRILVGALPGWEYRDDTNTTSPLQLDPRPPGHVFTFAFSPSYLKDMKLFVGSATPATDGDTLQSSTVTVCTGPKCAQPAALPGTEGIPNVLISRSFATTGQVFAWTADHTYRSTDGGKTFKTMTMPAASAVQGLAEDPDGALYASLLTTDPKGITSGGLFVSRDAAKTWSQVGKDTPLGKGAGSVASISHDRLLATPAAGGLLCSADAGKTWATRCPATP
jgi:RNA polymerase sigma-70 factor (ECF subfamily)